MPGAVATISIIPKSIIVDFGLTIPAAISNITKRYARTWA
jgi:hypothetical protein